MWGRVLLLSTGTAVALGFGWQVFQPRNVSGACLAGEAARTPAGFLYVPGSWCWIGSSDPDVDEDEAPRRRVYVASFYMGKFEVTQAEWKRFRPGHRIPPGFERYPITNVLRSEAEAYCRFVGGRLPTELEWEKAARGTDGRRYPWGDTFDPARANLRRTGHQPGLCSAWIRKRGLKPVEAHPEGSSPYGAVQMAGNAWEWVSGSAGGDPQKGIIRGGAVGYGERDARCYQRAIEGAGVT